MSLSKEVIDEIGKKALGDISRIADEKFEADWPELLDIVKALNLRPSIVAAMKQLAKGSYSFGFIEGVRHGHHAAVVAADELKKAISDQIAKEKGDG